MRSRAAKQLYFKFELNQKTYEGHYSYDEFLYYSLILLRNQYPFLSEDLLKARAKTQWKEKLKLTMETQQQQNDQQHPFWPRLSSSISTRFKPSSRGRPLKSQQNGIKFKRNTLLFNEDDDDNELPSRMQTPRKFQKRSLLVDSDEDDDIAGIQTEQANSSSIRKSEEISSISSQDESPFFSERYSDKISKTISSSTGSFNSKPEEEESSSTNETIIAESDEMDVDDGQIDDGQEKCSVLNKYIPLEDGVDEDQEIKRSNKPKFKTLTTTIEIAQDSFVKSIDTTTNIPKISISATPFMELEWNDDGDQEEDGELFNVQD